MQYSFQLDCMLPCGGRHGRPGISIWSGFHGFGGIQGDDLLFGVWTKIKEKFSSFLRAYLQNNPKEGVRNIELHENAMHNFENVKSLLVSMGAVDMWCSDNGYITFEGLRST